MSGDSKDRGRAVKGGGCRGLGRGALVFQTSSDSAKPAAALPRHYRPVSVDDSLPDAPPAIPGECAVRESWRYLSRAPVAYQMQVLRALEDSREERQQQEQTLRGATSREDVGLPEWLRKPYIGFTRLSRQKLQRRGADTPCPQETEEHHKLAPMDTKGDNLNHLSEPGTGKGHFQMISK